VAPERPAVVPRALRRRRPAAPGPVVAPQRQPVAGGVLRRAGPQARPGPVVAPQRPAPHRGALRGGTRGGGHLPIVDPVRQPHHVMMTTRRVYNQNMYMLLITHSTPEVCVVSCRVDSWDPFARGLAASPLGFDHFPGRMAVGTALVLRCVPSGWKRNKTK
jgi:hypothetical protein